MKEWILPTVGVFICWGLWGFLPKVTVQYIDPKSAIVYGISGSILVSIVIFFHSNFQVESNPIGILFAVTTGLVGSLEPTTIAAAQNRVMPLKTDKKFIFNCDKIISTENLGKGNGFLAGSS